MEPATLVFWGSASGVLQVGIAAGASRVRWPARHRQAQDYYVLAWWALAAAGFTAGALGAAMEADLDDPGLFAMLRLAAVLAFVLAAAALLAAGVSFVHGEEAARRAARRGLRPHPERL